MTQKKIVIPATIEEAIANLNGLGTLLQAKEWERAAIVYAYTSPESLTIRDFAAKGIVGLSQERTVSEYRRAWESAIERGEPEVKPGDTIVVPDFGWPPGTIDHRRGGHATTDEIKKYAREMITKDPQVLVAAMKAVPAVADAVVIAVTNDPELAEKHARTSFAHRPGRDPDVTKVPPVHAPETSIPDYNFDKEVSQAILKVNEAINREAKGTWQPQAGLTAALTILYLNLRERYESIEASRPAIFAEIDEFLATRSKEA